MTSRLPTIVLIERMYHADGEKMLAAMAELRPLRSPTPACIRDSLHGAAGVLVEPAFCLDEEAIRNARELLVISTSGRGLDSVDVRFATECGVAVVNNPGFGAIPVTEHAIGLLLDLAKQITAAHSAMRSPQAWSERRHSTTIEIQGKALGVIGCGEIGSEMVRKCKMAFDMRVLVYDPYVPASRIESLGGEKVEHLDLLLRGSDFVTLHADLNAETRGMIGAREFRQMRCDAYLINTARGALVAEEALVRALAEKRIAGAALDVFDPEPLASTSTLLQLPNVILSPHVAGITRDSRRKMALSAASQICSVLKGTRPPHLVNPSVWSQVRARVQSVPGR